MASSTAWERRNARARAEGFKNYYDKRTRRTPDAPKPDRDTLRRRRGHAGTADLNRLVSSGRVELVNVVRTGDKTFDVLVILSDGSQRSFTLRGDAAVARFRAGLDAMGADAPQITGSPKSRGRLEPDEAAELQAEIDAAELELQEPDEGGEWAPASDDGIPF